MAEREEVGAYAPLCGESVFLAGWPQYNKPGRIVTLGHYYPQSEIKAAKALLTAPHNAANAGRVDYRVVRQNLGWTKLIEALNNERQWPLKRLVALLAPLLAPDIALAAVPPHIGYQAFWPVRTLARELAAQGRIDATSCLVRHTTVRRITFGGPSTKALHRQTIRVENADLVAGRRVLLLDDIAKSGMSLLACRELLREAGAVQVQMMALGRVIVGAAQGS